MLKHPLGQETKDIQSIHTMSELLPLSDSGVAHYMTKDTWIGVTSILSFSLEIVDHANKVDD